MKRMLALLLVLATVATSAWMFAGCSAPSGEEEDLGAQINWFFVGEVYDFDPAKAYTNDEAMKVMSLIYEPLFSLDQNGNLQYALAKDYRFYTYNETFMLDITLRDTCWNNKEPVKADDVVYAWQRILAADFPCQAATLLYDIKGARAAKNAEISEYEVGIYPQENGKVVCVEFERELTAEEQMNFLRNLTSVALSPVYDSAIEIDNDTRADFWSKRVSYIVTNGPFALRAIEHQDSDADDVVGGHEFRIERNDQYRRNPDGSNPKEMYVSPYRFLSYWNTSLDETFTQFIEESIFIAGEIPVDKRAEYLAKAKVTNHLSTYTYVLDNQDPVFADARVRQALSLVIDRAALANEKTGGLSIPATGFVSHGVLNGISGSFSEATAGSDYALKTSANLEKATQLMLAAKADGYEGGSIRILHRDNAEETAIAEAIKVAWRDLYLEAGIRVSIITMPLSYTTFEIQEGEKEEDKITLYKDAIQEAFRVNDEADDGFDGYNVLAIDYQMLSPDAFSVLSSFADGFTGNGMHLNGLDPDDNYLRTHICGFTNEAYTKKIEEAFGESDFAKRTQLLHEAEKILLAEMPVIPLFFNRSAMLVNSNVRRVYHDYYGCAILNRTELRNYRDYVKVESD